MSSLSSMLVLPPEKVVESDASVEKLTSRIQMTESHPGLTQTKLAASEKKVQYRADKKHITSCNAF